MAQLPFTQVLGEFELINRFCASGPFHFCRERFFGKDLESGALHFDSARFYDSLDVGGTMSTIAIGIVNYNTRDLLKRCLTAVQQDGPHECYVVDSASTDGSAHMVASQFPEVTLFANKENSGFGAGANQIITAAQTDYVIILNSDAIPQPGAIRTLAAYLDTHPRAAIAGPKLIDINGCVQWSCRQFPGTLSWMADNAITAKLIGIVPGIEHRSFRSTANAAKCVPWLIGAAVALRASAVKPLAGFDERYFMYCEEMDLCLRLTYAGWEIHYVPDAVVSHVGGASTSQEKKLMRAALNASTVRFYRQHYSGVRLGTLLLFAWTQAAARAIGAHLSRSEQGGRDLRRNTIHVTVSDPNDH